MMPAPDILIVGAGLFGVRAAQALHDRGHRVLLIDQGPPPHPLAASTDLSKVVRMEYGADAFYMSLVEEAMAGFDTWNHTLSRPFYHQTGVSMLSGRPFSEGGFEAASWALLQERGHQPERLSPCDIQMRFPALNPEIYVDGFYHARGGWVESGALVGELFDLALASGVSFRLADVQDIVTEGDRCLGVRCADGTRIESGHTLLACGAWAASVLPELASVMRSSGHPVFHLQPRDCSLFEAERFPVFTSDIARTGWYGFPMHPSEGVLKIGRHGKGLTVEPRNGKRMVHPQDEHALRAFLRQSIPALEDAPVVYTRRCLYADTFDADYWMDHHPQLDGLSVATGGSGHGFKMAPVLGDLIADMVERTPNERLHRFKWRCRDESTPKREAARFDG
ncbi:MAG: FAD-dependent oxidoreductase [Bacteroidetes bacterium]|nr:FAD-dependent oxidoreductase [Bacteroidota bacterium]